MKYRVVREGKWFYPQYKRWFLPWTDFLTSCTQESDPFEYHSDDYSYLVRVRYSTLGNAIEHCIPRVPKVEKKDEEIVWESNPERRVDHCGLR